MSSLIKMEDLMIIVTGATGQLGGLIVSGPADPAPHRAAIEAARAAGAGRILYTSHMGANRHSLFAATRAHAETEQDLQASGVPFTSLRDGFHATSAIG